ncbi:16S rRNA (cytosine(967)-C(5))-methyltransferase RsmB [Elongatibacter sediminis]|uniref:16S rRNA (cytosine(967)-C(5))-methyltransferase n=1 Tax=Elongatibacter sediminis TaxID=3119006 RepID=A0AAW9RGX2_9GAMM
MKRSGGARLAAVRALADVLDEHRFLGDSPALDGGDPRERAQARHWAYGVLRWYTALDWLAGQLLSRPLRRKDRDIRRLVLLGLFQLWQDRTAEHAAIHETAECARRLGKPWAVGLINAVLRRFQREKDDWLQRLEASDQRWAHPSWLLRRLQAEWPNDWEAIVTANNQQPPLWLRHNRQGPPLEDVITGLEAAGFAVVRHPHLPDALRVEPAAPVQDLPGFTAGHLSVQDPAAQFAAGLLDVQDGMRVLDACAAPGGKTAHLLERHPNLVLTALDLQPGRLEQVRENLDRLRLRCTLLAADAAVPDAWWDGEAFDRILLDAPCSASGVIRRHPEIRHLRDAGQIGSAVELQARLLQRLWPLLAPGGILVYATCSVFKDENSHQIRGFLAETRDAEELPPAVDWGRAEPHGRQILPGEADMDGFYYAVLRKRGA